MRRKNDCGLLPHFRENVYGLDPLSAQIIGWEIIKFNVQRQWGKSLGDGVTVAVIDTGCDLDHPDIKNNLINGINILNKKHDPIDDNGHGTHVSGTIAAENNGLGMVGVAPKTKILPIKALDSEGNGNNQNIAKSIVYAADRSCDFITMSLGSPVDSLDIKRAIKYATNKKCIIFCAAGNSGPNTPIMYPAKYPETIAIGSIDRNLNRSNFTCSGIELDFLSPGQDILSCVPDNGYAYMSGTSMANPFAVGCASLILSYARKVGLSKKMLNKENYIALMKKSVINLRNGKHRNKREYEGYGIINPDLDILIPSLHNI